MNFTILGLGIILLLAICVSGPLKAIAEMHEITVTPPTKCGPRCVIESFVFDSETEAQKFAAAKTSEVYQSKGTPGRWFVDVMMTEQEANEL